MDQAKGEQFSFSDLSLRPLSISDVDDFMVWASDEKVTKFCSYGPYTTKEQGINYITKTVLPHPWFMAICLNDRPIGAVSVSKNSGNDDMCRGELGYVVSSEFWGKGVATWAVRAAAKVVFKEWPELERLEALTEVENVGSQKFLEKVGFLRGVLRKYWVLKGRTRDAAIFSLLSTDPVL